MIWSSCAPLDAVSVEVSFLVFVALSGLLRTVAAIMRRKIGDIDMSGGG